MFEHNTEIISRLLEIEEFEFDNLDVNKIQHVPMHQYRISSLDKPLLLIENLQVCIGLYAYSKNFGFAAHLNPVVMRGNEFQCDKNKNIIHCNRIDDLFNAIIDAKIDEPIYIGLSYGVNPSWKTYEQIDIINKSIDNLILKLKSMDIVVTKLKLKNNHVFVVDTINGEVITPVNKNIQESIKTK